MINIKKWGEENKAQGDVLRREFDGFETLLSLPIGQAEKPFMTRTINTKYIQLKGKISAYFSTSGNAAMIYGNSITGTKTAEVIANFIKRTLVPIRLRYEYAVRDEIAQKSPIIITLTKDNKKIVPIKSFIKDRTFMRVRDVLNQFGFNDSKYTFVASPEFMINFQKI